MKYNTGRLPVSTWPVATDGIGGHALISTEQGDHKGRPYSTVPR